MRHQHISFIKSAFRLLGYVMLPWTMFGGVVVLVLSEVIGIIEEIGHD